MTPARHSAAVTIASQKGGVGKTTLAAHLIWHAAAQDLKVLAVDLDTQGNLSTTLQDDVAILGRPGGSVTLLTATTLDELDLTPITASIDLLHAHQGSDAFDHLGLAEVYPRVKKLFPQLRDRYDAIIFDTPPSTNLRQLIPFTISNLVLIPTTPESFGLHGLGLTLNAVRTAQDINPRVRPFAIINRLLPRKRHRAIVAEIEEAVTPLSPYLADREAVGAAMAERKPVWLHRAARRDTRDDWKQLMTTILTEGAPR